MMSRVCWKVVASAIIVVAGCKPQSQPQSQSQTQPQPATVSAVDEATAAPLAAQTTASAPAATPMASDSVTSDSATSELNIVAWNVESGGADPAIIAKRLTTFGADIYGLSEVHPKDFETFCQAAGDEYQEIHLPKGNDDRLQLIYSGKRFELLERIELSRHEEHVLNNGNHRSPLAARLRDRESGRDYIVMVNHLARGNEAFRNQQAIGLREWARDQAMPCICIGDFNMDYEFATRKGNQAFIEMLSDNVWSWVEPKELIDSNWWDPEADGVDNFEGSLLDFAFVSGEAKRWTPRCEVIVEKGDFPDDQTTSDHRPIRVQLSIAR